jgi:hypothetical protein
MRRQHLLLLFAAAAAAAAHRPATVDLVLSHFGEAPSRALEFVSHVRGNLTCSSVARVFLYTHNRSLGREVFPEDWIVTRFDNVGRESYAYLSWLVEHAGPSRVHLVADHVWFSQAAPELDGWNERVGMMRRASALLTPETGMLALGLTEIARCEDGGSFTGAPWPHMRELYAMATRRLCESWWPTFLNGEFVVSRKRVLHQPASLWRYLRELLEAPPAHFIHREGQREGGPRVYDSTAADFIFGHMLERLWNPLFVCLDPPAPMRCCSPRDECRGTAR